MFEELIARETKAKPDELLFQMFQGYIKEKENTNAIFADSSFTRVIGITNIVFKAPVILELLKDSEIAAFLLKTAGEKGSVLIALEDGNKNVKVFQKTEETREVAVPDTVKTAILNVAGTVSTWGGELNEKGEHVIDLRSPSPGPHYFVNLLMGNRMGYPHALQTTPKSVVDRFGGGAFRSHAATQVLATRWDMRQEENGFPANRQFYLVEDCKKVFYSADPNDDNIVSATCIHSQNHTTIEYKTKCGLEIKRLIFILPQMDGLPLATEVQTIEIRNTSKQPRNLKLVYTGMFGSAAPGAIFEDVLYSNVILQARILRNEDGSIAAVVPHYYPENAKEDVRFHTMMVHEGGKVSFAKEFCCNYNEFVGTGTLIQPQGLNNLSNHLYTKGPGFFAVAGEFAVAPGETRLVSNYTGIVSNKTNPDFHIDTFKGEISSLIARFSKAGEIDKAFEENKKFYDRYKSFIQVETDNNRFDSYFNENLPFQVLYQTFVSRSFCQTQKGYREIGFREIQDIFASMYYFAGAGKLDFVKDLLKEWCCKIFEFGYAYHNFFWEGKEAGKWSDDALWFIQAVYRYINLSGDIGFLDEECAVAGTRPVKNRSVYKTIQAVLVYSGEISVGKHGMPLLDFADWNDCLKLDNDFIDGITKEKLYKQQIEKGGTFGEPFESNYSESVMNAFLLKVALDEMIALSAQKGDTAYKAKLEKLSEKLYQNLQEFAWKEDFFARVLFNRYKNNEYSYLGAKGDQLSADPEIDGTYFLNSFNWSILADTASDEQISIMLDVMEKYLKTPFGIKLISPTDMNKVARDTATGHYFSGDRENGGVFKHATMMATSAMLKAAKEVKDKALAARLTNFAYWMIDLVLPYNTLEKPFVTCGNPRFCTQYNNSVTGENIGPMLSGTSTWLTLTLMQALGIEYTKDGILLNPILREEQEFLKFTLHTDKAAYEVKIVKPKGFYRLEGGAGAFRVDGKEMKGNLIPIFQDQKVHQVEMLMK